MDGSSMSTNFVNLAYSLASQPGSDLQRFFELLEPDELVAMKAFLSKNQKLLDILIKSEDPPEENYWF